MRKKIFGKKLGRETHSRRALFVSLIKALVENGKIETTKSKAKAILPSVDKLVTLSKNKDFVAIRSAYTGLVRDLETQTALFDKIGKTFKARKGGYTRLINLPRRKGDNAEMVRLEWTEKIESTTGIKSTKGIKGKKLDVGSEKDQAKETDKKKTLKDRLTSLRKKK